MKRIFDYIRFKRLGSKDDSKPILLGRGRVSELQREAKKKRIKKIKNKSYEKTV